MPAASPALDNFRDLGGLSGPDGRIRAGLLMRGALPRDLPDEITTATAPLTVVDFRSTAESDHSPNPLRDRRDIRYLPLPIGGNAAAWVKQLFARMGSDPFPGDALRAEFLRAFRTIPVANEDGLRRFFDALRAAPGPVFFHCTAGKDRTGIAAALLLHALGINRDAVLADFLATNGAVNLPARAAQMARRLEKRLGRPVDPDHLHPLVGVEEAFLDAAFDAIRDHAGSVDAYIAHNMGWCEATRAQMRDKWMEPA
ncbi:tyrosine-protein phosphatase [Yunchengibacter salinarum]|uniref:tyrosine-protein phosphatase n=1 Tax=Yunchengibacter salinarum TaxID=3133399 RepID=UPI0035B5AFE1